jgi:hypothetical protein
LLSGNVSVGLPPARAGALMIIGDSGNNNVEIYPDPFGPTRSIRVLGNQGTTINGAAFASYDMSAFTNIVVNFQDGNNELHLDGPWPVVNGNPAMLNISAGAGNNYFFATGITVNALVLNAKGPGDDATYLNRVTVGSTASITTGEGADTFVAQGINIATLAIKTGTGTKNDYVRVLNNSVVGTLSISGDMGDSNYGVEDSTIVQGLAITMGGHSNYVEVQRNTIGNGASINVGQGGVNNQYVTINDNKFTAGDLNLNVGDDVDIAPATSVVINRDLFATGNANISLGNNVANVVMDTDTATGNGNGGGAITVRVGTNAAIVALSNITTSIAASRDLTLTVGDGARTVGLNKITAGSNLRIDGSTDNANTKWSINNVTAPNGFMMTTGSGPNTVALGAIQVRSSIAVGLGSGANRVVAHAVSASGGTINGGGNSLSEYDGKFDATNIGFNVTGFGIYK